MTREQVINQKATGRNAGPAAEKRGSRSNTRPSAKPKPKGGIMSDLRELLDELRALKPYLMIAGIGILSLVTIVLLFVGYRAAVSSSFFYLKDINVSGTTHTSTDEVKTVVRRSVAKSGVWSADLVNIKREIEKLPWIRSAIVSRVLPDGIRVRVTERVPRALVKLSKDRLVLVDEDANILGPATNQEKPAPFVLRGWDEAITDAAKGDNRKRVEVYRALKDEWSILGVARRVNEVNLGDVSDVRALVTFESAELEIRLGDKDFGSRLKYAINQAELESNSQMWPCYKYIDVSQGVEKGNRIIFGPKCSAEELERITKAKSDENANEVGPERDDAALKEKEENTNRKPEVEAKPKSEPNSSAKRKKPIARNEVKSGSTESLKTKTKKRDAAGSRPKTGQKTNNTDKNKNASRMSGKNEKKNTNAKPQETRPRRV